MAPTTKTAPCSDASPKLSELGQGQRLIVVSNRLPVTIKKGDDGEWHFSMSSGGLVSALSGCKKQMDFTWIGWPGARSAVLPAFSSCCDCRAALTCCCCCCCCCYCAVNPSSCACARSLARSTRQTGLDVPEEEREHVSRRLMDEYNCLPVYVSDEIADRHYNGFSNSILWPLFHYRQ